MHLWAQVSTHSRLRFTLNPVTGTAGCLFPVLGFLTSCHLNYCHFPHLLPPSSAFLTSQVLYHAGPVVLSIKSAQPSNSSLFTSKPTRTHGMVTGDKVRFRFAYPCLSEQDVMPYIYKGKKRTYERIHHRVYFNILLRLIKILLGAKRQ